VVPSSLLSAWQSFYVIVGSSGAALIGVQFVVITLVAGMRRLITTADSISAFATPTVVHLGGALVVSALMSAPWPSLLGASIALSMCSLGGLGYATTVMRRARRQTDYKPEWEDWVWYGVLPCSAYATLAVGALLLGSTPHTAAFVIGAAALGLLLIGIHNAWDTVTYVVVASVRGDAGSSPE
jgi:hypothetical protein